MKMSLVILSIVSLGWGMSMPAYAGKAHVHGNADMQVVVDSKVMEIAFQSPLDSLVGFEHAPRNEKQRKAIQAIEKKFRDPDALFVPTEAAQCAVQSVALEMPYRGGAASNPQHRSEHAELEATIGFQCANPMALKGMEVRLFEVFPKLHKIDVQTVSGSGQSAARLTPKQRDLQW